MIHPINLDLHILEDLYTRIHAFWRSFIYFLSGGKMNDFLTIRKCSFYNYLMHEQLAFKTHDFLSINLLKQLDKCREILNPKRRLYIR